MRHFKSAIFYRLLLQSAKIGYRLAESEHAASCEFKTDNVLSSELKEHVASLIRMELAEEPPIDEEEILQSIILN